MEFEKRLREGIDLPDAIKRREAHFYLHLMREWFSKLAAQSRYDEGKLKEPQGLARLHGSSGGLRREQIPRS